MSTPVTPVQPDPTDQETSEAPEHHQPSPLRGLLREPSALIGLTVLAVIVLAALLAPWIAPSDPKSIELLDRQIPPFWSDDGSAAHVLGTDALGRDVLSSVIYGARASLLIALTVVVLSGAVGTCLGLIAGLRGGWLDSVIMRVADAQVAFPAILLVALLAGAVGAGFGVVVIALTVFGWMVYARLVRGAALKQRSSGYIVAAELIGCSRFRIMRRHLLPNLRGPLLTQALLEFAHIVLAEAAVSYLGFGIQPPNTSWGLMISENQQYLATAWWSVAAPGVALAITVLMVNLVGSALRREADPHAMSSRRTKRKLLGRAPTTRSVG